MLILARRANNSIMIGDNIEIKVVAKHGDKVTLGITAPRSVTVLRKELFDAARKANVQAASPNVDLSVLKSLGALSRK